MIRFVSLISNLIPIGAGENSQKAVSVLGSSASAEASEESKILDDFFTLTRLGRALRSPLASGAEQTSESEGCAYWDTGPELQVYRHYADHVSEATRQMVEYGDSALATCSSERLQLHLDPRSSKPVWDGRNTSFSSRTDADPEVLPNTVLQRFTERWRMACDSAMANSVDAAVLFPKYLLETMPCWSAILEVCSSYWSEALRCELVEKCVLPSFLLLKNIALHLVPQSTSPDSIAENERTKPFLQRRLHDMAMLVSLHRLLHFLHLLALNAPGSPLTSESAVVEVISEDFFSRVKKPTLTKLRDLINKKVILDLLSFFSFLAKGARCIFDSFEVDEKEGCDFELTAEGIISSSFTVALSIVSQNYPHSELRLVVKNVTTALNVLLHRLAHLENFPKPLMNLLLLPVIPGLEMVSEAMRLNPLTTANVLSDTAFHVLMADCLRQIGYQFSSPEMVYVGGGDDAQDHAAQYYHDAIRNFTSIPSKASSTGESVFRSLNEPSALLASYFVTDEVVNNLLKSFLLFRHAQRLGMEKIPPNRVAPEIVLPFRQLDSIVVRIFFSAEYQEELDRGLNEGDGADSCLAGFLIQYVVELLSWTKLGDFSTALKKIKVDEFRALVQLGLYRILLCHECVTRAMRSNTRILYTVLQMFYVLATYPITATAGDNAQDDFNFKDREQLLTFLLQYLTKSSRVEDLSTEKNEFSETLYSAVCSLLHATLRHGDRTFGLLYTSNVVTKDNYDKGLIAACVLMAQRQSCRTLSLRWLLHIVERLLQVKTYRTRALLNFPDVLTALAGSPVTKSFGFAMIRNLLCSYAVEKDEDSFHRNDGNIVTMVSLFWNLISQWSPEEDPHQSHQFIMVLIDAVRTALQNILANDKKTTKNPFFTRAVLQHQFCAGDLQFPNTLLEFAKEVHASRLGLDSFMTLSAVFRLMFYLVKGNPERRKQLTMVINAQEFFSFSEEVWKEGAWPSRSKFDSLVMSFLHFAFDDEGDPVTGSHSSEPKTTIHNPKLLVPAILSFTQDNRCGSEHESLSRVIDRLFASASGSVTDCFWISKAGIFNALGRLLPLCHAEFDTETDPCKIDLKKKVTQLMSLIAAQQIDVRHVKQFISSTLINTDLESRRRLLPDVAAILRSSLKHATTIAMHPETYISFRPGSGRVGVRAVLPEFPGDGYAVSMWFHAENRGPKAERTLFAVENSTKRTIIKCFLNSENVICTSFLDRYKNNVEVLLGGVVPTDKWSHVVVIHHRPGLLQVEGKLQLLLNGEVVTSRYVRYPSVIDGKACGFTIGSPGSPGRAQRAQGQLFGCVTNIYFFPKAIGIGEAQKLYHISLRSNNPIPYLKGPYHVTKTKSPALLQYHLGQLNSEAGATETQPELLFAEKAAVFIDPRVGDGSHLYNVAEFMKGNKNALEKQLTMHEGTVIISGALDIRESLCLTDAVNGIVMPLMILLINPTLPFPLRWTNLEWSSAVTVSSCTSTSYLSTLLDIVDIISSLASTAFVRECTILNGVFVMLSFVVERLARYLNQDLPHRLMELCLCFVEQPSLFKQVYASLFLCSDAVHSLCPQVQLQWWRCQLQEALQNVHEIASLMRAADIQMFVVQEIVFNMEHLPQERAVQEELYNLLDTVTISPITQGDATPLLHLTVCAHELFLRNSERENDFAEALYRIRMILYTRDKHLALYLSQTFFMAAVFPLFSCASASVRREAVLLTCLLVQRCKTIQRLMNPAFEKHQRVNVVHAVQYVELGWIGKLLSAFPVTVETYMTLRTALTHDRMERRKASRYKSLGENILCDELCPHILSSISHVLVCSSQVELKVQAAMDLIKLMESHPWAVRQISTLSRWYAPLTDLYCSYFRGTDSNNSNSASSDFPSDCSLDPGVLERHTWRDKEVFDTNNFTSQLMVQHCASAMGACLRHVLSHETYGQREYVKACGFLVFRGAHSLLCRTLQNVVEGLDKELCQEAISTSCAASSVHAVVAKDVRNSVLRTFMYTAEDYIFYSLQYMEHEKETHPGVCYDEQTHLYMTPYPEYEDSGEEGWLHLPLAFQLCLFLATHATALKEEDEGVMEWITGHGIREGSRHGGLHRVFARFFRVAVSFTLRCTSSMNYVKQICHQFGEVVQSQVNSLWSLRQKRLVSSASDIKTHSTTSSVMILLFTVHDLLKRRLEKVRDKTSQPDRANEELIGTFKKLFTLFKTVFEQLTIFSVSTTNEYTENDTVQTSTFEWLLDTEACKVREYKEITTRKVYKDFIAICAALIDEAKETDKLLASSRYAEICRQHHQLREEVEKAAQSQDTILERLERYTAEHSGSPWWPSVAVPDSMESSFCGSSVRIRVSKASTAIRSSVWASFRSRVKGSMWRPLEANGPFVRLSVAEQRSHCRRKLLVEESGTDHREAVRRSSGCASDPVSMLYRSPSQMRLASPSEVQSQGVDVEEIVSETQSLSCSSTYFGPGELEELKTSFQAEQPPYQSFQCEMIYMMQCWSATLTLQNSAVCIAVDEHNVAKNSPVAKDAERYLLRPESTSFPLLAITYMAPGRRYRMKRNALEIWFRHQRSILLNFPSPTALIAVVDTVSRAIHAAAADQDAQPDFPYIFSQPSKEPLRQHYLTKWKSEALSNFDYLMWLNFLSGRSMNDLSQYPVFPWVLANYESMDPPDLDDECSFRDLSKPIGVSSGTDREEMVRTRYEEQRLTGDIASHYFSHYSSPAAVTFFLIRLEPFTSLHLLLQGGTFDLPDRMFHSISSTFRGVTTNLQDVREMIPEMYYLPEMCVNFNKIPFGLTSQNEVMHHLVLPPWAHGCPYEFVYRMREALESDYVSQNLHHWIDLIFGYKQRGRAAVDTLNVFQCFSYEDTVKNRMDEPGMTDFVDNIGQTPIQLFKERHPERRVPLGNLKTKLSADHITLQWVTVDWCESPAQLSWRSGDRVVLVSTKGMAASIRWAYFSPSQRRPSSVCLPAEPLEGSSPSAADPINARKRRTTLTMAESFSALTPGNPDWGRGSFSREGPCTPQCTGCLSYSDGVVFVVQGGLFDNTVIVRPITNPNGTPLHLRAHHGHVTHIAVSEDSSYIVTGARDSTFIIWSCSYAPRRGLCVNFEFMISTHDENPGALDVCSCLDTVVTSSVDGVMLFHSLSGGYMERRLVHPSRYSIDHILIQRECYVPNVLFASNTDDVIHQVSLNGAFLRSYSLPGTFTAWCCGVKQYVVICFKDDKCDASSSSTSTVLRSPLPAVQEVVIYLHSFFLTPINKIRLPSGTSVTTIQSDSAIPGTHTLLFGTHTQSIGVLHMD